MSVITALTAQNTRGVSGIHVVPSEFVKQQIDDVIVDIPPKCIKTGNAAPGRDELTRRDARQRRDHQSCCECLGKVSDTLCC